MYNASKLDCFIVITCTVQHVYMYIHAYCVPTCYQLLSISATMCSEFLALRVGVSLVRLTSPCRASQGYLQLF